MTGLFTPYPAPQAVAPHQGAALAADAAHPGVRYRPEIDGLRAIAVVAVMAHHADLGGARGGFTGVDIFFVISGYLISAIILHDLGAGRFSYREFYIRRALRILPAMLLVTAASVVGSIFVIDPATVKATGQSAIASVAMLANVYFWLKSGGYFGLAAPNLPLIHLWSLAVEEQFYLIVTPVLVLLSARGTGRMAIALGAAALLSFALSCHLAAGNPDANYFLLPSRGWELLAGILVRLAEVPLRRRITGHIASAGAIMGAGLLIAPIFLLTAGVPFPGFAALPTIAGTCLVIGLAQPDRGIGRLLASPPLVGIGLVSYSSYLWHQPLLALFRLISPDPLTPVAALLALGLSLVLGAITWRTIEAPFRRRGQPRGPRLAGLAVASAAICIAAALLTWGKSPIAMTGRQHALAHFAEPYIAFNQRCRSDENPERPLEQSCRIGAAVPPTVAIVGDSFATGATAAFAAPLKAAGRSAMILTAAGCAPLWVDRRGPSQAPQPCDAISSAALDHVLARTELRTVVLVARWPGYLDASGADDGEGRFVQAGGASSMDRGALRRAVRQTVMRLLAAGRKVILIYPSPVADRDVPRYLLKRERLGWQTLPLIGMPRARFEAESREVTALLDTLGAHPRLKRLYPARGLCDAGLPGRCLIARGGRPLYFDDNHLSAEGARVALPPQLIAPLLSPHQVRP